MYYFPYICVLNVFNFPLKMEEVSVGFIDWRFFLEILPSHN
jgi:hypothetical protein